MRVYVQVPVSGRSFEEALKECDERCTDIAAKGHEAVNPLRVLDLPSETTSREAIGKCVALLMTCDAIYAHPSITNAQDKEHISSGCLAEACAALAYGLKFIYDEYHDDGSVELTKDCEDGCAEQGVATTALYKVTSSGFVLRNRPGERFGSSIWGNKITIANMLAVKIKNDKKFKLVFDMAEIMKNERF